MKICVPQCYVDNKFISSYLMWINEATWSKVMSQYSTTWLLEQAKVKWNVPVVLHLGKKQSNISMLWRTYLGDAYRCDIANV